MSKKALIDYSEQLMKDFEKNNIKFFDYSHDIKLKRIGQGGYAVVYSAILEGNEYALKSLNNNLDFTHEEFKKFNREKTVENTPLYYANLYKNCWSSEPNLRPTIDEILIELEKSLTEPVEFITNLPNIPLCNADYIFGEIC
ncbi:24796_t:CDS:2 [Dentiscutata erythropus]|uniref:24796_t:CDS:1 n=1 Tax=Dentiscutata erythropus TaxID=1348616 RepID=A0A9N9IHU5_9GLOM|nr:24796_t:CDS:2 [Dentiscutata erythropus]